MHPDPLDGNATAGDLTDVFAFDTTVARTTCAACRDTHVVAALRAYLWTPGIVLRCSTCDAVQLRLVQTPNRTWLDVTGIAVVTIPRPIDRASVPGKDIPFALEEGRGEHDHL